MGFAGDCCLSIFEKVWETGALVFPPNAKVLEIGCAEADWMTPMLAQRPDLQITGIDWRGCERPGLMVRGDVLTTDFSHNYFDAVVCISSIEHIGLGHYDADPLDVDGDMHCRERAFHWLKPGGWFYADVPYSPEGYQVHGTDYRAYDEPALKSRLIGPWRDRGRFYANWQGLLEREPPAFDPNLMHYVAVVATKE